MDAIMGIGSLCRHLISNTSSRNPSNVAIKRDNRDDKYTDSFEGCIRSNTRHQNATTHFVVWKLWHNDTLCRLVTLWSSQVQDYVGECEWDEEDEEEDVDRRANEPLAFWTGADASKTSSNIPK